MSVLKKVMCLIQWCLGKFSMCYKREIYCIVDSSVDGSAKALQDGARATPRRDVFGAASRFEELVLCWRYTYFHFLSHFKTSATAFFIKPKSRFAFHELVVIFRHLG